MLSSITEGDVMSNATRRPVEAPTTHVALLPTFSEVCESPEKSLSKLDIAAMNLICATGLPGAEDLSIADSLEWIDMAARTVDYETQRNYQAFLDNPAAFQYSQARFCILHLVTVLQRQLGVRYNPKWEGITPDAAIPREFGADANDVFIHAIVKGIGGTCSSLPVLYVAVGRRIGYPLKLVKALQHLFFRWDDPTGKHWVHPDRFNVEATSPGVHFLSDEEYKAWPHTIADQDLESGTYLKSLTPDEELAEALVTRANVLWLARAHRDAADILELVVRLAPHNRHFAAARSRLYAAMLAEAEDLLTLAGSPATTPSAQLEPSWITGPDGREMLVQIPRSTGRPLPQFVGGAQFLVPQPVQLPNGGIAIAHVPLSEPGVEIRAEWARLPNGEHVLIHRRLPNARHAGPKHAAPSPFVRAIWPEGDTERGAWQGGPPPGAGQHAELLPHERAAVVGV